MKISVKLLGIASIIKHFSGVKERVARTIQEGMKEAAFIVEGAAKRQITSGPNRAIKTGFLRSSIGVQSILPFKATVIAGASYGIFVHEGTRFMRGRPFMQAGLKDSIPEIERIFGKRLKTVIAFT